MPQRQHPSKAALVGVSLHWKHSVTEADSAQAIKDNV
jgi:hypothetical protein